MKIQNIEVNSISAAIRGMRNPKKSGHLSDSQDFIGSRDLSLAGRLIKAGTEHRKFLRMITVTADITAPRFWWMEWDTYGHTVSNSESTMHTIMDSEFTIDDFETDSTEGWDERLRELNELRNEYIKTRNPEYFRRLIEILPQSYRQKRTVFLNYETLLNQYRQRKGHRLREWSFYLEWIEQLPYMPEFLDCAGLGQNMTEEEFIRRNIESGTEDGIPWIGVPNIPGREPFTAEEIMEVLRNGKVRQD